MTGKIERWEGLLDGTFRISLLTREKPEIQDLMDKVVDISIKEKKHKRSLDANGYYWVLQGKMAEFLHVSKPFMHNLLLRRYGQLEIIEGKAVYIVLPDTEEAQAKIDQEEYIHLRPTSEVKEGRDGIMYRTYMLLRGSHTYNTAEMSKLIDGLVSECEAMGIPTETPEEIEKMKQLYGARYERKNKKTTV